MNRFLSNIQNKRSMQPVPPAKNNRVIGICFLYFSRVMNPVHVRADKKNPHEAVQRTGQGNVAVVEENVEMIRECIKDDKLHRYSE